MIFFKYAETGFPSPISGPPQSHSSYGELIFKALQGAISSEDCSEAVKGFMPSTSCTVFPKPNIFRDVIFRQLGGCMCTEYKYSTAPNNLVEQKYTVVTLFFHILFWPPHYVVRPAGK